MAINRLAARVATVATLNAASLTASLTGRPKTGALLGAAALAYVIGEWRGVNWATLRDRTLDALTPWAGTIARDERKTWRAARTLQDLCNLTIRWLQGDLKTQPGYYGAVDIDDPDVMRDALVALNRAGFLTRGSQEGTDQQGLGASDIWHWVQVAAVEGLATPATVARLRAALHDTPYSIESHPRRRGWWADSPAVDVTWVRDHDNPDDPLRPYTCFGGFGRRSDIEFQLQGAGQEAVDEAADALQVVIWDPQPGRNTLWGDLHATLTPRTADTALETR